MNRPPRRLMAMAPRILLAILALHAGAALAQTDDFTAPPMVPADEGEQPQPEQPQQFQYAEPGTYANEVDPEAQQQPPPGATKRFEGSILESQRSKHVLALASGSLGITRASPGVTLDVRAEADIGKFVLLAGYTGFGDPDYQTFIGHFMGLGGWAIFSREEITWRVLGGLDVINLPEVNAVGFAVGTNVRAMFTPSFGIDSAVFLTPLPFRQFEFRVALVARFWSIFEAHAGWRYQALDATVGGTLGDLFTTAPSINGPMVGLGLAF